MASTLRLFASLLLVLVFAGPGLAQTVNVYTAWPESLSQPIFKAYTAKTGVQINFLRLSTGELVARATSSPVERRMKFTWTPVFAVYALKMGWESDSGQAV